MSQTIISVNEHLRDCDFHPTINRPVNDRAAFCSEYNSIEDQVSGSLLRCGNGNLSKQACLKGLEGKCSSHWRKECKENGWDHEISKCANRIYDRKKEQGLILIPRVMITQFNIQEVLGLTPDPKFNHISDKRRKEVEEDVYSEEEEEEEEEDGNIEEEEEDGNIEEEEEDGNIEEEEEEDGNIEEEGGNIEEEEGGSDNEIILSSDSEPEYVPPKRKSRFTPIYLSESDEEPRKKRKLEERLEEIITLKRRLLSLLQDDH
jgi:hypothetical protein